LTSAKSLATRFYQLKCGHAPTGAYLKRFGHREDDKCWWCGAMVWEYLLHHCSRWKYQQRELWKKVGKATGWKAGRCRRAQASELFSIQICDMPVMDCLVAMDVGKFPLGWGMEAGAASLSLLFLFLFLLSAGTKGSRWELRHLTGSPRGGGNKGLSYSSQSQYSMNKQQQQLRHNVTS